MESVDRTELSILSEIGRISTSSASLAEKLRRSIDVIMQGTGREGASVFLLDPGELQVTLAAARGLHQEAIGKLTFPIGAGIAGWVAQQKVPLALADPYSDPRFSYAPESGIERFRSLVAAPIMDEEHCLGVLFVLSAETWHATRSEITLLTTVANQLSGVIRSARFSEDTQARLAELTSIHEISMALTSTLDAGTLVSLIAKNVTRALGARGCSIRLASHAASDAVLPGAPVVYLDEHVRDLEARIAESVQSLVIREKRSLLIGDASREPSFGDPAGVPPVSVLGAPLLFHDRVIGVIILYRQLDGGPFSPGDLRFLTTIAGVAAAAVENAALFEHTKGLAEAARSRAQEFSILYDVGTAMSATLNLDRLLRIILTAATMGGGGLGFNRAILLLVNERSNTLQGMMGVGPTTWEEANRAWTEVARKHRSLIEWIQTGELFEPRDTEINAVARSIRVPLDPGEGVLALTVLNKQPYNIVDDTSPLVRPGLRDLLKVTRFATVPLIAKGRVIGVILVDNMFTQRPIVDHDLRFLTMFARNAALAIDNAMLHSNMEAMNRDIRAMHEQLAQSEKMAALGAMMAEITHEIRNPLVSIGGFARRLGRKVDDPDARKYLDIILGEVARLESIIHDNLAYIKSAGPRLQRGSLNPVLEDVLQVYEDELRQRAITIEKDFAAGLPDIDLDGQQMKQVIVNVITNAMEAMEKGGVLSMRTLFLQDRSEVLLEIGDTGPGVSAEAMSNLFNPYYTTKARGTGLGLPIAHRIIKAHHGAIVFRNKEGGGAVFVIRLPLPRERP